MNEVVFGNHALKKSVKKLNEKVSFLETEMEGIGDKFELILSVESLLLGKVNEILEILCPGAVKNSDSIQAEAKGMGATNE